MASSIDIEIKSTDDSLQLCIKDDGIGFDTNKQSTGFGLDNMQQNATLLGASLTLESHLGTGTITSLTLSLR